MSGSTAVQCRSTRTAVAVSTLNLKLKVLAAVQRRSGPPLGSNGATLWRRLAKCWKAPIIWLI
eukprot:228388-Chlamydomonas_euryale.AAC.3